MADVVISWLMLAVFAAMYAVMSTVSYRDLRVAKDGVDAEEIAAPVRLSPPDALLRPIARCAPASGDNKTSRARCSPSADQSNRLLRRIPEIARHAHGKLARSAPVKYNQTTYLGMINSHLRFLRHLGHGLPQTVT